MTNQSHEVGPNEGRRATKPGLRSVDELAACTRPEDRPIEVRMDDAYFAAINRRDFFTGHYGTRWS